MNTPHPKYCLAFMHSSAKVCERRSSPYLLLTQALRCFRFNSWPELPLRLWNKGIGQFRQWTCQNSGNQPTQLKEKRLVLGSVCAYKWLYLVTRSVLGITLSTFPCGFCAGSNRSCPGLSPTPWHSLPKATKADIPLHRKYLQRELPAWFLLNKVMVYI